MNAVVSSHARYSASGAHRWLECTASIGASDGIPDTPSKYAEEGTKAHKVLELILTRQPYAQENATEEMLDAVTVFIEYVNSILKAFPNATLHSERSMKVKNWPWDFGGTVDCTIYVPELSLLYVIDLKFGAGEIVEVEANSQVLSYAMLSIEDIGVPVFNVIGVIIQPRAVHAKGIIREVFISPEEINEFKQRVISTIVKIERNDVAFKPGKSQCRWCKAKVKCPAIEAQAVGLMRNAFKQIQAVDPTTLDKLRSVPVERLADILARADMIKGWLDEARELAEEYARSGIKIPGYKLVEGPSRRSWKGDVADALSGATGIPAKDFTSTDVKGITEIEDMLTKHYKAQGVKKPRAAAEELVNALTTRVSSGKLHLVPASDSAVEYNPRLAFASVTVPDLITSERKL